MKKLQWPAVLALCLLLGGCAPETPGLSGEEAPVSTPTQPPLGELQGTVYDATMSTLVIETEEGARAAFAKDPELVTAPDGIIIGYEAEISYRGELDPAADWQSVEVLSIRVAAAVGSDTAAGTEEELRQRAGELLAAMGREEKLGQLILARCPRQNAAALAAAYHLGGYVLFGENVAGETAESLSAELRDIQAAAAVPLLIAVDEEGGSVNRLSTSPAFRARPFASPTELYRSGGWEAVEADAAEKCALLRSLGIQVNLAPVCDVCSTPDAYMFSRSFGADASLTARYVSLVVESFRRGGVGCVLKHFPGYGDNGDTHVASIVDNSSLEALESKDLVPFAAGIGQLHLVGHV